MTERGDGGGAADGSVGDDSGADALPTANAAVFVGGSKQTEVTEMVEQTVTMVETRWPLPMLRSVSVAADGQR